MKLYYSLFGLFFLFLGEQLFSQDLEEGLIAHYLLDGNALDNSGHNNNGTIFGASLTNDRLGNTNSAYYFNGETDYVLVPNSPSLNPTDAITVSAWYKTTPFIGSGNDGLVNKAYMSHIYPHYQYQLGVCGNQYWNAQSGFGFTIALNDQSIGVSSGSNFYNLYTWYHVVGTFDGTNVKLYVNGILLDSKPASGKMRDYGSDLYIARHRNRIDAYDKTYYLPGTIDDVRIYNRALSDEEINDLYNSNQSLDLTFSYQGDCINNPVKFNYSGFSGYDSLKWDFGDNLGSNEESPSHTYYSWGDFNVTLNLFYKNKKYVNKRKIIIENKPIVDLGNDTTVCPGNSIYLDAGNSGDSYLWNNGSTQEIISLSTPGKYSVKVVNVCGSSKDSISINYSDFSNIYIPKDTFSCKNSIFNIFTSGPSANMYIWNNSFEGKEYQFYSTNDTTLKLLVLDPFNCQRTFETHVKVTDCLKEIMVPNVFTPNGDGKNDFWIIENLDKYPNAIVEVFNRWGELVYKSTGYKFPWDGFYNGKRLNPGCYFYIIILNTGHNSYNGPLMIYE